MDWKTLLHFKTPAGPLVTVGTAALQLIWHEATVRLLNAGNGNLKNVLSHPDVASYPHPDKIRLGTLTIHVRPAGRNLPPDIIDADLARHLYVSRDGCLKIIADGLNPSLVAWEDTLCFILSESCRRP